jgi:hypothetical protein
VDINVGAGAYLGFWTDTGGEVGSTFDFGFLGSIWAMMAASGGKWNCVIHWMNLTQPPHSSQVGKGNENLLPSYAGKTWNSESRLDTSA